MKMLFSKSEVPKISENFGLSRQMPYDTEVYYYERRICLRALSRT